MIRFRSRLTGNAGALFEAYSKSGEDSELKTWAGKTLPHLKEHLSLAEEFEVVSPRPPPSARDEMTNYLKLPTWADSGHVHAVVETPRGSRAKLEFDPKLGAFTLAKPLLAGLTYPYDWGFIPSTKAETATP